MTAATDALDLAPLWLSLRLAATTTLLLLLLGTPLAWWLARTRHWARPVIESLVVMPLVLPPTVLGFYLLVLLGRNGPLGWLIEWLDVSFVFTFRGLVIGSIVFSLPFVVYPLRNAFEELPEGQLEVAATLGAGPVDRFFSVVVPLAWSGFLAAAVLGFAHTLGEFGVVLMLGGSIPGETQVLSIAIYNYVEQLDYARAHVFSALLVLFSFAVLLVLYLIRRPRRHDDP
ncbi:MAG TPA: molybdate ABC transporter permease subunit [Steroidobacteraceae bacterium]|nr:molybdate ABC transporter permease subunit [Steroidobacteraceae bacterium]